MAPVYAHLLLTNAAIFTISSILAFGKLLDGNCATQKRRAYVCCMMRIDLIVAGSIWIGIKYSGLGPKSSLDYSKFCLEILEMLPGTTLIY